MNRNRAAPPSTQVGFEGEAGENRRGQDEGTEFEGDRDASHKVDPLPPAEFRLFGLGGKKKRATRRRTCSRRSRNPGPHPCRQFRRFRREADWWKKKSLKAKSTMTPHHHQHKTDEHDLDDYEEEEKLHTQIRSGELGEMLQEAHLDHRIQMNFDDKNGEEGEDVDDDEDEEEEAERPKASPPADGHGSATARARRTRTTRTAETVAIAGIGRQSPRWTVAAFRADDRPADHQRAAEAGAGDPGADRQGADCQEGRAHHQPHRAAGPLPGVHADGESRRACRGRSASDEERQRLKRILISEKGEASGGFIVRTAAEGASEEELRADLRFLISLWNEIKQRSDSAKSPALIYHDLNLVERILRDQVSDNFSTIWVDSEAEYERIVRFLNRFQPSLVRRVKLYTKETPLFEQFGIQDEITKALQSKVWLKSGGSIVINQTEALVAIDINTGKYVGKTARLEDTILKTNLDAIPEIVRQIRLRDLGGIIVIDFIDMDERKNRHKVMAALEEELKTDRAPSKVLQFNDFGLVAITRKRVKQSLERTLSVPCAICQAPAWSRARPRCATRSTSRCARCRGIWKRRCDAARASGGGEGAEGQQRTLAERAGGDDGQDHHRQERPDPASGAVRYPGVRI